MKLLTKTIFTALIFACASMANASLITNGSFEDNDVNNNQWKWFTSDNVNGWDGSTIEIWDSLQNFDSFDGEQHAELNAHGNKGKVFTIYQTFATTAGEFYDFSFAYAARTNKNEQFSYSIFSGNTILETAVIDNNLVKQWTLFEGDFQAIDVLTTISFTSITPSTGTLGNFLDAIVIEPSLELSTSNVSSPATTAFILAGFLALGTSRKITSRSTRKITSRSTRRIAK